MSNRFKLSMLLALFLGALSGPILLDPVARAALTSQVNSYVDGNVLTAAQLNAEFGNIYSTINNLDNANLSETAGIVPTKISSSIDGTAISRDSGTGALSVSVDNSTIETNSDSIRLKDAGITAAKLGTGAVTSAKILDATIATADIADDAITGAKIAAGNVVTSDLADNAVTKEKIEVKTSSDTVAVGGVAISSSSGSSVISVADGAADATITNNSVTITSRGGPIYLQLIPGPSPTVNSYFSCSTGFAIIAFARGGTVIDRHRIGAVTASEINYWPVSSFSAIDIPSAGTYTYTAVYRSNTCDNLDILNVRLMAYEL